jgi:lipopolysaccharide assembly outer membrane protein LptD (OstA)
LIRYVLVLFLLICEEAAAINISADVMSMSINDGSVTLKGNAVVSGDNFTFSADEIVVIFFDKKFTRLKYIKAKDNVKCSQDGIEVTARSCEGDMSKVRFMGAVSIESKPIGKATGDSAEYKITADSAVYDIKNKQIAIFAEERVELVIEDLLLKERKKRNRNGL